MVIRSFDTRSILYSRVRQEIYAVNLKRVINGKLVSDQGKSTLRCDNSPGLEVIPQSINRRRGRYAVILTRQKSIGPESEISWGTSLAGIYRLLRRNLYVVATGRTALVNADLQVWAIRS